MVAKMVLAKLACRVAEIKEELGKRRGAGLQVTRTARELRRDHASAYWQHPGKEGVTPGGAALLRVIVSKQSAFLRYAVDIWRFAQRQAAMISADLHPADVIAHDEENVGLTRLLRLRVH